MNSLYKLNGNVATCSLLHRETILWNRHNCSRRPLTPVLIWMPNPVSSTLQWPAYWRAFNLSRKQKVDKCTHLNCQAVSLQVQQYSHQEWASPADYSMVPKLAPFAYRLSPCDSYRRWWSRVELGARTAAVDWNPYTNDENKQLTMRYLRTSSEKEQYKWETKITTFFSY